MAAPERNPHLGVGIYKLSGEEVSGDESNSVIRVTPAWRYTVLEDANPINLSTLADSTPVRLGKIFNPTESAVDVTLTNSLDDVISTYSLAAGATLDIFEGVRFSGPVTITADAGVFVTFRKCE